MMNEPSKPNPNVDRSKRDAVVATIRQVADDIESGHTPYTLDIQPFISHDSGTPAPGWYQVTVTYKEPSGKTPPIKRRTPTSAHD